MQLLQSLFVYGLALFYGLLICLRLLWETIRKLAIPPRAKRRETPPACLLDPELGEHNFLRTASNLRIHYVAKGDPSKPLMLCLHGFPEFWYSWRYQLKAFSDNYRVVAVDMRGYGESDHPKGRDQYKMSYLVNDIKEMVEALGYKSCVLMAHDWGGFVAWSVTHVYPELVDKLIVCNIPHPKCFGKCLLSCKKQFLASWQNVTCGIYYYITTEFDYVEDDSRLAAHGGAVLKQFELLKYMFFFQLPYLPEYLIEMGDYKLLNKSFGETNNFTEEDVEAYKYALCQSGCSGPINYYRKIFSSDLPRGHTRTKIRAPTLVVWGTGDKYLMKETLKGTEQYVENVTIKYIEGASHWVQVDDYVTVNKHIRDFLNAYPRESLKKPD